MIKRILMIFLSIYFPASICGQTRSVNTIDASAPKIVFSKTSHYFGELALYSPAFCEFKFYNKGKTLHEVFS